jgi:hypothetical protein
VLLSRLDNVIDETMRISHGHNHRGPGSGPGSAVSGAASIY